MINLRDRLLQLREEEEGSGQTWAVFADMALALLLVMVLFILAQFLHYEDVAVLEEIDRRRGEVAELIRTSAERAPITPAQLEQLTIRSEGFAAQRIRFPEPMLFGSCETDPQPQGVTLVEEIGQELEPRGSYFEAIQIEGHADITPPTGACEQLVGDNWGLSSMRATSFLRILVSPEIFSRRDLVSAVGRGDSQRLTEPGAPPEELVLDRRVELILQYSEEDARRALRERE
jgi:outer membrane protein OmpA-like peptidoglycan-associated protein